MKPLLEGSESVSALNYVYAVKTSLFFFFFFFFFFFLSLIRALLPKDLVSILLPYFGSFKIHAASNISFLLD